MKKTKRQNDKEVIADRNREIGYLNRELTDLRVGLNNTAAKFAECMVELEDARAKCKEYYNEVARLNSELIKQGQYQTRAHETIELLVKKMPYPQ